jgi:hypothetical protein
MFLLPVLFLWGLLLLVAYRFWRASRKLPLKSLGRKALVGVAVLMLGLLFWWVALLMTADSLW